MKKTEDTKKLVKELAIDVLTGALLGLMLSVFFYFYLVRISEIGG